MDQPIQPSSSTAGPLKQLAVLVLILLNSALSFWLWTTEFESERDNLVYLKHDFFGSDWMPLSAIPICFLLSLSLMAVISLFSGKANPGRRAIVWGLTFALTLVAFYGFRFILMDTLKGFIKLPILAFACGLIVILPLFCLLMRLLIHRFVLETGWMYALWLWLAVFATMPLSLGCLFALHGGALTNDWYLLTAVQKGYPVFWIHVATAAVSYLYFRRRLRSTTSPAS